MTDPLISGLPNLPGLSALPGQVSALSGATDQIARAIVSGKFLHVNGQRFLIKGVTYGTFEPDAQGLQFPRMPRVAEDFSLMAKAGINTVRTYTAPPPELLDEAARSGLRVMVGLPWPQHVAFLDDRDLTRQIRRDLVASARALGAHAATLLFALGNEIPPAIVRWHGRKRIERFIHELYDEAKAAAPDSLFTYVNYPPTEYLDLSFLDVCAFNVYLHREADLRAYLARLQHIAGTKPFLLAEAGADSIRETPAGQARLTATHLRAGFSEGACGAIAFAWTDEWWRGGAMVEDWAFGLVDSERRPKPALEAVSRVFLNAPFSHDEQRAWPKVSVVVCAYNAADTLEDCLSSLERLTYPNVEVLVVNDGSRDETGSIVLRHPTVRLIEISNGGLSAARNVGLSQATGDIVVYTDADTRVDPDWLTYLVQPFLTSDVVGAGGPNAVPADDAWIAQCIARAPGGPTHVLLDDRIAEHVPGCNMAFRRDALLAIGGFNPIYLRAGDDVDVCWRLQARGGKIGFAPSALVWHHHRASVKVYWRQQVGYGEGETWLIPHHPDKFIAGQAIWRGRIYSALPFIQSLSGTRINAGVWGTALFPSVYRTDVHPIAFLPHSFSWQAISVVLVLSAITAMAWGQSPLAAGLLASGLAGLAATAGRCLRYAFATDIDSLGPIGGQSVAMSRTLYRLVIAGLHLLQPLARARGRFRGMISPPQTQFDVVQGSSATTAPSFLDAVRAVWLLSGIARQRRFWSERWVGLDGFLTTLLDRFRLARLVRVIEIDDGWREDRDLRLGLGRWGWIDVRVLIEEHAAGKCLVRVASSVRPTLFAFVTVGALGTALAALAIAGATLHLPVPVGIGAGLAVAGLLVAGYRAARMTAAVEQIVFATAVESGMMMLESERRTLRQVIPAALTRRTIEAAGLAALLLCAVGTAPFVIRDAFRSAPVLPAHAATEPTIALAAVLQSPGGLAIAANGDLYVADSNDDIIQRIDRRGVISTVGTRGTAATNGRAATSGEFDTPGGVALAPNGDLLIADSHHHRVCRIDRVTGEVQTLAGSGVAGFSGDGGPASAAELDNPSAVAMAANGDLYIADTMNNRVRVVDHASQIIRTIAGDGNAAENQAVGDGAAALAAHLFWPSDIALAQNGDLYIADMHHNRIRRVDHATQIITTMAGNGTFGSHGDAGPATSASLAGPAGIALAPDGAKLTVYVADYYNGVVRVVRPDGVISTLATGRATAFGAPSRIAYHPRGWLYVADATRDRVMAIAVPSPANRPRVTPKLPTAPRRVAVRTIT